MSKTLFVPVILEALRVGSRFQEYDIHADMMPRFDRIDSSLPFAKDAVNSLFTNRYLSPGIHLHWTMPDSLLRGAQSGGNLVFPRLPNRWILQRVSLDGIENTYAAWQIHSDLITGKAEWEKTTLPTFRLRDGLWEGAGEKGRIYGYLGGSKVYGEPWEPAQRVMDPLTAVGYGDPLFAAFYPYCRSVFGFYDDMESLSAGRYAYLVTGCYEEPAHDPLYHATADTLKTLGWTVPGSAVPERVCCHAYVTGVIWNGKDQYYETGAPADDDISVYVGNTSAEALGALVHDKLPDVSGLERVITALQYGQLYDWDDTGNADAHIDAEYALHERQFCEHDGGEVWLLRRLQEDIGQIQLTEREAEMFTRLNDLQTETDTAREMITDLKSEIYFAWFKFMCTNSDPYRAKNRMPVNAAEAEAYLAKIRVFLKDMNDCRNCASKNERDIMELAQTLNNALKPKNLFVQKQRGERYYMPNTPVLLLCGKGVKRAFKQGFQSDTEGCLPCRLKPLASIAAVADKETVLLDASAALGAVVPAALSLQEEARVLLAEMVMLQPDYARALVLAGYSRKGKKPVEAQIKDDIARTQANQQALSVSADAPFDIARRGWKQPWHPLLMQWHIHVTPARSKIEADDTFARHTLDAIDWEPIAEPSESPVQFQGATLITPHAVINLADMLRRLIENYKTDGKPYESLQYAADAIEGMDILSQRLDGFNEAMLMRDNAPFIPLYFDFDGENDPKLREEVRALLREMNEWFGEQNYRVSPCVEDSKKLFLPIRGGVMTLKKCWLVDSFGQGKQLESNNMRPSESMSGKNAQTLLRPRVMQPLSVRLDWRYHANERICAVDETISPIFGYVVPSFLDGFIQIHDQQGSLLGFVQRDGNGAKWMKAPGSSVMPSGHLQMFVDGLTGAQNPALRELLSCLDRIFEWMAPAGRVDFLQLCFGRILALARATVGLYDMGVTPRVQEWSVNPGCNGLDQAPLTVRLGDARRTQNGLAGFYTGDKYDRFHSCVDGNNTITLKLDKAGSKIGLSLLLDPRGDVPVQTGFLPEIRPRLEAVLYENAIENMELMFRAAPLIAREDAFAVPIPGGMSPQDWSFLYVDQKRQAREYIDLRRPLSLIAPGRRALAEGFLKTKEGFEHGRL